jgi:hypothetical protein
MEDLPLRAVAVLLFQNWLDAPPPAEDEARPSELTPADPAAAPWIAITQHYVSPGMSHDMAGILYFLSVTLYWQKRDKE